MLAAVSSDRQLPGPAQEVLDGYRRIYGDARLWRRADDGWRLIAATAAPETEAGLGESAEFRGGGDSYRVEVAGSGCEARKQARLLALVLERVLELSGEITALGSEIMVRYEEITLLYSISETLGSVISLEDAARTILTEVIGTLSARRAALWVHDPERDVLYLAAAVGMDGQSGPIEVADRGSVTAAVFRQRSAMILDPEDVFPRGKYDRGITRRGYFLSVPVSYTPPQGETRNVGVINLVGRTTAEPFNAGDLQLMSAIASQIGAAVENGRLVAETLRRQRLVHELELAHDLQLKLLPSVEQFAGYAEVAARCIPADSVGGDFYHLFRLSGGRLGVLIGDVSSHGFSAALIMALTMSAVAIHASEGHPPAEVLRRLHHALIDELESTEMFLTLFYGVIDPAAGQITYSNSGHHHAFRIRPDGTAERLGVTNAPFGMVDLETYAETSASWEPQADILFLFTDGLPDTLAAGDRAGEKLLIETVSRSRAAPLCDLVDSLFSLMPLVSQQVGPDDRTAVLVRI
jgi:phosphoserine phosphatase RsbU/P